MAPWVIACSAMMCVSQLIWGKKVVMVFVAIDGS
jgi:hypothetical protein